MTSTRDRIIVSTNELFRRQGYHGTSLSQISQASSATIGSIYHFFPGGKEGLAVAVVATTGAVYRELFEAIVAGAADAAGAYVDFFAAAGQTLAESDYIDPCPIGTVAREVANTSEQIRVAADEVFRSWVDAARSHLERSGIDAADAERLGTVFVALVEGSFVLSRTQRSTAALESAGCSMEELVRAAQLRSGTGSVAGSESSRGR